MQLTNGDIQFIEEFDFGVDAAMLALSETSTIQDAVALLEEIEFAGISKADIERMDEICPGFKETMVYGLGFYSDERSTRGLVAACEGFIGDVFKGIWAVISGVVKLIIGIIAGILNAIGSLFGFSSSISSGGGGSCASYSKSDTAAKPSSFIGSMTEEQRNALIDLEALNTPMVSFIKDGPSAFVKLIKETCGAKDALESANTLASALSHAELAMADDAKAVEIPLYFATATAKLKAFNINMAPAKINDALKEFVDEIDKLCSNHPNAGLMKNNPTVPVFVDNGKANTAFAQLVNKYITGVKTAWARLPNENGKSAAAEDSYLSKVDLKVPWCNETFKCFDESQLGWMRDVKQILSNQSDDYKKLEKTLKSKSTKTAGGKPMQGEIASRYKDFQKELSEFQVIIKMLNTVATIPVQGHASFIKFAAPLQKAMEKYQKITAASEKK